MVMNAGELLVSLLVNSHILRISTSHFIVFEKALIVNQFLMHVKGTVYPKMKFLLCIHLHYSVEHKRRYF